MKWGVTLQTEPRYTNLPGYHSNTSHGQQTAWAKRKNRAADMGGEENSCVFERSASTTTWVNVLYLSCCRPPIGASLLQYRDWTAALSDAVVFGDLHLILNSKDDLFTAALHLKELRSYLATGSAAITGVSRWKIATISASTSSKLQQAFGGSKSTDRCASIRRPPRSNNRSVLLFIPDRNTFSLHSLDALRSTSSWCSEATATIKCTHRPLVSHCQTLSK